MEVIEQLCEVVEFSLPMEIDTRMGKRLVRKAPAGEEFWKIWRANKQTLQAFGISASVIHGRWEVCLWSDDHLQLPELPNEIENAVNYDWESLPPLTNSDRVLSFQISPVKFMVDGLTRRKSYLLGLPTGMGKCLGKDTEVVMYNGSIKKVQNIVSGDKLMGDDNSPRNVLTTVSGTGMLYRITPNKGKSWVCNIDHVLSLKNTETGGIVDIPLSEYLGKTKWFKHCHKLYRKGIELPKKTLPFDPYSYGCWLGDGTVGLPSICKQKGEISDYLNSYFKSIGYRIKECPVPKNNTTQWFYLYDGAQENPFKDFVKSSSLNKIKFIREEYLSTCREDRCSLLAGLLDCDGYLTDGCFEIVAKSNSLANGICRLARSLGLGCTRKKVTKSIKSSGFSGVYNLIIIYGDFSNIPFIRHKPEVKRANKDWLRTGFSVEEIDVGEFYGFSLDGNHRFLLGDFTVNHNTFVSLAAARELGLRVITICPKTIALDWMRAADYMGVECDAFGWEHMKLEKTEFGYWDKPWWVWNLPENSLLILDELHRGRNLGTQNSLLVHAAGRQEVLSAGLSATMGEDPRHLNAIGRWLGLHKGGPEFFNWAAKLGVVKQGDSLRFPENPNALRKLHKQIFPEKGCRLRWSDVGEDAPEDQTISQPVAFDNNIASVYQDLIVTIKEITEREDKASRRGFILAARTAARQKIELLKAPTVVQMAKDLIEEGNSVFIAVNFHDTLDYIMAKLKITACIKGGQSDIRRRGAIDAFQADRSRVIVGIVSACREGISLHDLNGRHPRYSLIMPCESSFDLKQVLGRTPRAGSKSPSFQRLLYAAGTIEEEVCYNLSRKLDNMSLLNDSEVDPLVRVAPVS